MSKFGKIFYFKASKLAYLTELLRFDADCYL